MGDSFRGWFDCLGRFVLAAAVHLLEECGILPLDPPQSGFTLGPRQLFGSMAHC